MIKINSLTSRPIFHDFLDFFSRFSILLICQAHYRGKYFSNLCTLFRKIYKRDFTEIFVRAWDKHIVCLRKVLWSYVAPQKFIHYAATLITPFLRPQNIDFLGVKVQFFDIFPNCTYNYQKSTKPIILKNCLELAVCLF